MIDENMMRFLDLSIVVRETALKLSRLKTELEQADQLDFAERVGKIVGEMDRAVESDEGLREVLDSPDT